ncbi:MULTISPECIES: PAAR domain-containing protein [Herbaspirillum]|uniref:PAAR domain-containing protein n=1 Tax=Herbaspirillum huttiense subsp. lycopersici TaxID=3074428 RepID=A0ABU2EM27_9BURK|nr:MULTISPECIES: PAAR domain-containing protein [Herbaspirillum]MDR6741509.1 putative Zn-binding protein involved in type VI secretion [Herbaspirillum sp. 1173]MDR9849216.1 PAAR domain-containing protein [Herbaspirillum huttiense SE1]
MPQAFITIGDRTSHGGTVISGDLTFMAHGKPVARVGDQTVCPRCQGTFAITTGAGDMFSLGAAVARHGDRTACGATLIASQATSTHAEGRIASPEFLAAEAEVAKAGAGNAASADSGICLSCMRDAAVSGATLLVRS